MEKTIIRIDYDIALNFIGSFYALYMSVAEEMGGKENDPNLRKEGEAYARKKFIELAREFEDALPMRWEWVSNEEDEEKND